MLEELRKYYYVYALEIVGAIIANFIFGLVGLIIYCFIVILLSVAYYINFLRKLIRITQVEHSIKLEAIIRKLKVTDAEIRDITEEIKGASTGEQWASLEKDLKDMARN